MMHEQGGQCLVPKRGSINDPFVSSLAHPIPLSYFLVSVRWCFCRDQWTKRHRLPCARRLHPNAPLLPIHLTEVNWAGAEASVGQEAEVGLTEKKNVSGSYFRPTPLWPQLKFSILRPTVPITCFEHTWQFFWPRNRYPLPLPSLLLSPLPGAFTFLVSSTQNSFLNSSLKAHNSLKDTFPKKPACPFSNPSHILAFSTPQPHHDWPTKHTWCDFISLEPFNSMFVSLMQRVLCISTLRFPRK